MKKLLDLTFGRAMRFFLAGVFALLPLAITVAVISWVGDLVSTYLGPSTVIGRALSKVGFHFATNPMVAYAFGAAAVMVVIFVIGIVVEMGAKNLLQRLFDAVLQRIPIIGSLYGTSKQLVSLVDKKQDDNLKGMRAAFCFFGGPGGAAVLALLVSPQRFCINGREYHIVVVPTSPVPVGGGLLFVPVENVRPADVSMEAVVSIYVSMGVTAPQFLPQSP